ncbi:2-polyprenyl-6-methoxyphenol hydroxylase [Thioclava sp. BHET1]|nr:2-polyprenyl-6-methoxyphenol hydroxylase [Thioclava sp. BHET1]
MQDPVLIAGAGPTGLTAALELSRMGVRVRLVDRAAGPATTSRAIGVHARTLELLAQRGLAQELIATGMKIRGGDIHGDGKSLMRLDFSTLPSRFPYILFTPQSNTEAMLRKALARQGVEVEWGTELIAFGQHERAGRTTGIEAVLRTEDGIAAQDVSWLIATEGAHSLSRATLGVPFEGETMPEQFALADLQIDGEIAPEDLHMYSSEHGLMGLFPLGAQRFRLIVSHPPGGEDRSAPPRLDQLQAAFDARADRPARLHDLTWSSWFQINSRMVTQLRVGRVILGGDSAHIHSPAGAQGMNTGIQDMINLCWKLARVIKGQSGESLLDSYEDDRRPVMEAVLNRTERLTEVIGAENPLLRSAIAHIAPIVGRTRFLQSKATMRMSQLAVEYRDGPISVDHAHAGSLYAGDRMPDLDLRQLRNGRWVEAQLYPLLDPTDFTVLIAHPINAAPHFEQLSSDVPFERIVHIAPPEHDRAPGYQASFDALFGRHARCVLIRPDGYIAMTCPVKSAPHALKDYAHKQLGAISPPEATGPPRGPHR